MKLVGLITEYNPFHNGHAYHLQKALQLTQADAAVVVMSGDFVQRGAPAVCSKYERAAAALRLGAAAVFELPVSVSCQSAEFFAEGAVALLDRLGCIDALCFGCETSDPAILTKAADLLLIEPVDYRIALKQNLKQGLSYPAARQAALASLDPAAAEAVMDPNNILAVEYLKALKKRNSRIEPCPLKRTGSGYHEAALSSSFSSATAIRQTLLQLSSGQPEALGCLHTVLPSDTLEIIKRIWHTRAPLSSDDFSLLLKHCLLREDASSLTSYADVSEELANRIYRNLDHYQCISQFITLLKTRELTHSRISRALFHILLGQKADAIHRYREADYHFYARLLGFRRDSTNVLRKITSSSELPVLTAPAKSRFLPADGLQMLQENLYCTALYESVLTNRFGQPGQNELRRKLLVV